MYTFYHLWEICIHTFLQRFIDTRCSHTSADAHGYDPSFRLPPFQLMEELSGQFGACASQRMTKGDGPAVGINISGN